MVQVDRINYIARYLLLISWGHLAAQSVLVRGGNIVYVDKLGKDHKITDSGKDRDPSLSPDGTLVVFVRRTGEIKMARGLRDPVSELWVADASGEKPPHRVLSPPVKANDQEFSGFYSPEFAPGNELMYFLIDAAPTSTGIMRLSLADHSLHFIALALEYRVITRGDYSGYLIVLQRRLYASGGVYTWYWLFDPDGKEYALIGSDEGAVRNFLAETAR